MQKTLLELALVTQQLMNENNPERDRILTGSSHPTDPANPIHMEKHRKVDELEQRVNAGESIPIFNTPDVKQSRTFLTSEHIKAARMLINGASVGKINDYQRVFGDQYEPYRRSTLRTLQKMYPDVFPTRIRNE